MQNIVPRIKNAIFAKPTRTLFWMLMAGFAGLLYLALPDAGTKSYGVSAGYKAAADALSGFSPKPFLGEYGVVYPLVLAVGAALGMAHYVAVGLFNLAGVGVLAWRLNKYGLAKLAIYTAAMAALVLFSATNIGFATSRLPESIALGGGALVLAMLFESFATKRSLNFRLGMTAGAMVLAYNVNPAYVLGTVLVLPAWVWIVCARGGVKGRSKLITHAAVVTAAIVGGLLVLGNAQVIDNINPDRAQRIDAYAMDNGDARDVRKLGRKHGSELPMVMATTDPMLFVSYGFSRGLPAVWNGFVKPGGKKGVCRQPLGNPRGLPDMTCNATAWALYFGYAATFIGALATLVLSRRIDPETGVVLMLSGAFWGLCAIIALTAWSGMNRFLFIPFAYGAVALPMTLLFFRAVYKRLKATPQVTAWQSKVGRAPRQQPAATGQQQGAGQQ